MFFENRKQTIKKKKKGTKFTARNIFNVETAMS